MLYLKQTGEAQGQPSRLPLDDVAAASLERALLADDAHKRRHELNEALASDRSFASWTLRRAEHRTARTFNRVEEAAEWLCGRLELELADALEFDPRPEPSGIAARLTALVAKLAAYERKVDDFDRQLEREKLESLKELAYGASHEINNPLANIAARAQTLLADETDPERTRKLQAIHRQAMRAHEMISDLMLFARPPKLDKRPLDLRALVNRVVHEQREFAEECEVEILWETGGEPVEVSADETQIGVAVQALVRNGLEAAPPGGHVWIHARQAPGEGQQIAEITVRDDGPGISTIARQHLFDPFFSGREAGRGLGFGLSKCWRIVTDHGGKIVVSSSPAAGAEFCLQLPAAAPEAAH